MANLKQSTSYSRMFLMVLSSDHISPLTGATCTVTLSKAGGSFAAAGGTITEVSNGWYKIVLTTTDTNTLGDLAFHITATSGDPTDFVDQVTANILGDTFSVNVASVNSVATTSVTTINAIQGTTQPLNFTGTSTSALVKSDIIDIASVAVSTSTAQIGTNVVSVAGAASNIKKNQALNAFEFPMTDSTTHAPKTGVTVTATRSLDGAAFSACANAVTEIANGVYSINLATTDLNANVITLRFTGSGSDDRLITIITQP